MRKSDANQKNAMNTIQKTFKKRGSKALEMAKKEILQEKVESKAAREALSYFMKDYWHDLARPSLLSLTCEAVGGDPEITVLIAIPMTLISGALDIHDDIIDQSKRKDGRQTVYGKFGKDVALLIGDALLFKGLTLLSKADEKNIPTEKKRIIIDIVKNMFFELGNAEALELQFRGKLDVTPEEYLRVMRKKAADVEAHTRISAILGGASPEKIEALGEYGRLLGMLILLRDDWIDILDFEESRRRITKESLPLPLLYGLHQSGVRDRLREMVVKRPVTRKNAESILKTIQKTDVPQIYAKLMSELVDQAILKLEIGNVKSEILQQLVKSTLSQLIEQRSYGGSNPTRTNEL